jgi:hypothetical protein
MVIVNTKKYSPLRSGMIIQVWITDELVHRFITDDHKVPYEPFFSGSKISVKFV